MGIGMGMGEIMGLEEDRGGSSFSGRTIHGSHWMDG